jgi:predicted Zn-dependent peptidase
LAFQQQRLANGLQIIGEESPSARSVAVGFFVRTGARDEVAPVSGVTHFLEHMVFKGTPRRTALDVNRDFDRIGASYNAFTSEENTVFYAAILPEYLPHAVDILADILRPSLRTDDFDIEKNVIIEEIGMYEDQPMWSAYDQAKRAFFGLHPVGNSILGTVDSIRVLKRDQMHEYFTRRYVAPNITVVVAGNFDWQTLVELVGKHCSSWNAGSTGRKDVRETHGEKGFHVLTRPKVTQQHIVMLAAAPAADSKLRHAADVLTTAIGDDSGSRLYWALVNPGLADSADAGFHDYEGTGSYITSISCEPGQAQENVEIVDDLLQTVQGKSITEEELRQAKNKIASRIVRGSERPMGRMQAIGMSWTYLNQYRSVDDELAAFDAVTLETIGELLARYPVPPTTTLTLGPLETLAPPGRLRDAASVASAPK